MVFKEIQNGIGTKAAWKRSRLQHDLRCANGIERMDLNACK
jgi:hypothetical protein